MFTKIFLIGALGTGILGTGAVGTGVVGTNNINGITPASIELAAGPVRISSGNGTFFNVQMASHTPLTLTVNLRSERRLQIKF